MPVYSPRRLRTGSCSGQSGNVLSVGNCCYVAVCRRGGQLGGATAPTEGGEGRGHIVSRHAHSLFFSVGSMHKFCSYPSDTDIVSKRLYISTSGMTSLWFSHITYSHEIVTGRGPVTQVDLEKFRNFGLKTLSNSIYVREQTYFCSVVNFSFFWYQ